ncbi:hypothetical protein HY375_01365 [Candidatus Berkelbacteria bacterium]|nr:hypothetical protein [Candidatus Berkelbacteria bacterium]
MRLFRAVFGESPEEEILELLGDQGMGEVEERMLKMLTPRQRFLARGLYVETGAVVLSQRLVGVAAGISGSAVRTVVEKGFRRLRHPIHYTHFLKGDVDWWEDVVLTPGHVGQRIYRHLDFIPHYLETKLRDLGYAPSQLTVALLEDLSHQLTEDEQRYIRGMLRTAPHSR